LLKEAETRIARQEQSFGSETHRCFRERELLAVLEGNETHAGVDLEAARKPHSQALEKPNQKALWLSAKGRLVEEALLWQAVLDQDAADPSAIYFLAKAYDGLSAQTAGELFKFHPDSYRAKLLRGEAFERGVRLDLDKALAEYGQAAKLAPESPGVQHAVGRVLWKMNRFDEAIPHLEKELQISATHGSAHLLLGKIFLSRRQTGTAIAHLQEALKAQPGWVEAERDLGRALVMEGRYDEGIKTYQRILARDPLDASVHALLAVAYRTAGQFEAAKISAEKASDLNAKKHQPK
jgi:tetratricopeptide (TPR) repeat protein